MPPIGLSSSASAASSISSPITPSRCCGPRGSRRTTPHPDRRGDARPHSAAVHTPMPGTEQSSRSASGRPTVRCRASATLAPGPASSSARCRCSCAATPRTAPAAGPRRPAARRAAGRHPARRDRSVARHEAPEPREGLLAGHLLLDDRGRQRVQNVAAAPHPPVRVLMIGTTHCLVQPRHARARVVRAEHPGQVIEGPRRPDPTPRRPPRLQRSRPPRRTASPDPPASPGRASGVRTRSDTSDHPPHGARLTRSARRGTASRDARCAAGRSTPPPRRHVRQGGREFLGRQSSRLRRPSSVRGSPPPR